MVIPFIFKKSKPLDLINKRIIEDNLTIERMSKGIKDQYKRFNEPEFASKELRDRLLVKR